MNELIAIAEREGITGCDARELHAFMEVGTDYSTWIRGRIAEYKFKEGQDFEYSRNDGKNQGRGRPALECHISLDMAKELAMVERTEKGRQIRRYFIECEKQLRAIVAEPVAIDMDALATLAADKVIQRAGGNVAALVPTQKSFLCDYQRRRWPNATKRQRRWLRQEAERLAERYRVWIGKIHGADAGMLWVNPADIFVFDQALTNAWDHFGFGGPMLWDRHPKR